MINKLFVYGTLKGMARPGTKYVQEAMINGNLYHLGWYPGVKVEGEGVVHGEVYEITNPDAWRHLDAYEGCPNLYKRVEVETLDGDKVYTYHYNGHVREETLISNGMWEPNHVTHH